MKRNKFIKVSAIKKRNDICPWQGGIWTLKEKANFYENLFHKNKITEIGVYEYIPVQIVSCLQNDLRKKIIQLLKIGEPYITNSKRIPQIKRMRIDIDALLQIKKEKLSTEEVMAYELTFDSFEIIHKYLSVLFDTNFLHEFLSFSSNTYHTTILTHFRSKWPATCKDLSSTFKLRDIFCDEFDALLYTDIPTLLRYLQSSILFMESLDIFFNYKMKVPHKHADSKKAFEEADLRLSHIFSEIIASIEEIGLDAGVASEYLDVEILLWKNYRKKHSKQMSEHHYTPILQKKEKYWNEMERLTLEKIQSLEYAHSSDFEFLKVYRSIERFR